MSRFAVDAPASKPSVGGLLPVANVTAMGDPHMALGLSYPTEDCGHAEAGPGGCVNALGITGPKTFDGLGSVTADPFVIYKGVECGLGGFDQYAAMARRGLERGQGFAIERGVQTLLLNSASAVNLTPAGGAVKVKTAVATLEQYAAERYTGLPLFHVSKFGAVFLPLETGWPMLTKQGSPVANGGGYTTTGPGGVVAGANEFWLYVSGQVNIWQGDITTVQAPNIKANTAGALAERIIVATVECFVGAIRVTTEGA